MNIRKLNQRPSRESSKHSKCWEVAPYKIVFPRFRRLVEKMC
jgi:hypothetical protein